MTELYVGVTSDFKAREVKTVRLLGKVYAVFKRAPDRFEALEFNCKHQHAPLRLEDVDGNQITCRRHGWRYDLGTGACVFPPEGLGLRTLVVRVVGEKLYLVLGA